MLDANNENEAAPSKVTQIGFPSEAELAAAGYVSVTFHETPDIALLTTAAGHPFPTHEEIVKAGYIPHSRRTRRIQSRARVGQMYWIDFPHDACAPEFVREHPGIVVRAGKSLNDTCIIVPVTSSEQKAGTHFYQLVANPNKQGQKDGVTAYVVCDHLYTVHVNRLRPLIWKGNAYYPRVTQADLDAIFGIVRKVLNLGADDGIQAAGAEISVSPSSSARPIGPNTLTLPKKVT